MKIYSTMDALSDAIKRAALETEAWQEVKYQMRALFDVGGAQLASVDHSRDNEVWSRSTVAGVDQMMAEIGPQCEPVLYAAANPHWRVFTDYDYIDEGAMDASAFYRRNAEFDIRYRLGIRLVDHPSISRAMVLFWNKQRGHADRDDFRKVEQVVEQLRLSAHVSLAMGQSMSAEQMLIDNLERSNAAALVVDPSARVILANSLVDPLLNQNDGVCVHQGQLTLQENKGRSRLSSLILRAGSTHTPESVKGGVIAAQRPSGLPPYLIMVTPLPRKHQFMGDASGLALVVIHDTTKATEVDRNIYMEGFGMTAAEADVAAWFLQGATLDAIATRRGVSLHTVRQQLKDILKKTGTHRQAELAVLLASLSRY